MNVKKMNLSDSGFCGYLAKDEASSKHGIVVFLGGESVMVPFLKLGRSMAKLFAKRGYTAVSVSLFGSEGLTDSPDHIPLEYGINAVKYLKEVENCTRISVFGMSMGSIFALGTAIYGNGVNDLIMMSPSHVAFEGVSKDKKEMRNRSFITLEGKDLPYVSANFSKYKMHEAYQIAYANKEREAASMSALPITKANARVLLMAGSKDSSWPSEYSVNVLYDILKNSDYKYDYQKYIYPDYGHMLPLKKDVMNKVYSWLKAKE